LKTTLLLILACIFNVCLGSSPNMDFNPLPGMPGWSIGPDAQKSSIDGEPPDSGDPAFIVFVGLRDPDQRHRLYRIPAATPVADVVNAFRVGSHGAETYDYDVAQTVRLVSQKATQIAQIIPCRVVFADAAGLKLKFLRQISDTELQRMEALFPRDQQMQAGLDRHISEWSGQGPLLGPLKQENMIHLWWD
jgi:hypothetical protein